LLVARKQLQVVKNRYRDGLMTYLEVATAEGTELNIEFSTVQLRGPKFVAAVSLMKSLGAGWQEKFKNWANSHLILHEVHKFLAKAWLSSPKAMRYAGNVHVAKSHNHVHRDVGRRQNWWSACSELDT